MPNLPKPNPRIIATAPEPSFRVCDLCLETVPDQPYCDRCGFRVDETDWSTPWLAAADDYIDWLAACPF